MQSASTSARPTRSSPCSRLASPPSSPTPRARAPRPRSSRFAKAGEVLVGEVAKRQAITNPDRTIRSVKRHMGTDWKIEIDGKDYRPQEISARMLQKLKRDAEAYLGDTVTQAVITVPAYFDDAQRTGHQGGRRDRRPRGAPHHQRADRGRAGLRPRQGRAPTRPSSSSTSAAAPSTCPCSRSATASSRSRPPTATPTSVATTGTSGHRLAGQAVQEHARRRPEPGQDGPPAPEGGRGEGEDRAVSSAQRDPINLPFITLGESGPLHLEEKLTRARVPGAHLRPARPLPDAVRAGHQGRRHQRRQDRPRDPGRRLHPHAGRRRRWSSELTGGKEPNKGVNPDEVVALGAASRPAC